MYTDKEPNHLHWRHDVNYEDIFFMLIQMHDHLAQDFNPYGKWLIESINVLEMIEKWEHPVFQYSTDERVFIRKVASHIYITISRMLKGESERLDKLETIRNICKDENIVAKNIFSLNHDTVIEQLLIKHDIPFTDGFGHKIEQFRLWTPGRFFDKCEPEIRLLKLHGSINWRNFSNKETRTPTIASYEGQDDIEYESIEIPDSEGNIYVGPGGNEHEYLVGTTNKIIGYFYSHYRTLHDLFRKYLKEIDCLIVVGYGFGDYEINEQILEWLLNQKNKIMVIIDQKEENVFIEDSTFQFRDKDSGYDWHKLFKRNLVRYINAGIENTDVKRIKEKIEEMKVK